VTCCGSLGNIEQFTNELVREALTKVAKLGSQRQKRRERKTRRKKRNCKAYLTLSCPTFSLKKPHLLPFKRFFECCVAKCH